jgi:hypothetical protein
LHFAKMKHLPCGEDGPPDAIEGQLTTAEAVVRLVGGVVLALIDLQVPLNLEASLAC